jgi:hypothetical protein
MLNFAKTLESVLVEHDSSGGLDAVGAAKAIVTALQVAKQKVHDLEHQLATVHQRLSAELALAVRKIQPGLNVGVNRDGTKVGYKTKHLLLVPDTQRGVWNVKSADPRFAKTFFRHYTPQTVITNGVDELAQAIVLYFVNHYRSLSEDISGTGVVFVEDRHTTLGGLVAWRDKYKSPLNSRATQRRAS